ncbi:protein phosphatase 1 regulatory subunit 42-like [Pollicipes pollicipes]|uniref:protein phosphatase 1 regulatory subunit 42-like n=1 Tax=Pollicipes pollicipes TaxID=41117 RepID=UPI0018859DFA|nr:protein phosphatase 1 regulatory subunit 42-like [Pollicipes pollicipes]
MNVKGTIHSDDELQAENSPIDTDRTQKQRKHKPVRKPATHLRLQNHGLRTIPSLTTCTNLVVLYLYNNRIDRIQNLDSLTKLTHLYLTHNNIKCLENLTKLANLQKLYIGQNKISVLEGLEGLHRLRELHMEGQRLPAGDSLSFDPRSIQAVRGSLSLLNIHGNRVTSLQPLAPLSYLTELICTKNQLSSLASAQETLAELPSLTRLDVKANPLCQLQRYRDALVESAPFLRRLDELDVTPAFRQFVSGRVQAVARRLSLAEQAPPSHSASGDALLRPGGGLGLPRAALSQGSLLPARRLARAQRTSSTHLRVGNMLTLTPQQRALVRAAGPGPWQPDVQAEPSSGDFQQMTWSGGRETLPRSPAKAPSVLCDR